MMRILTTLILCMCVVQPAWSDAIALTPKPRLESYSWMSLARWYEMHSEDVELAFDGESDLLFIGDSITEGWQTDGLESWEKHFSPRGAVDFGIGGDMTQNLLWRLDNGSAGKLDPKAVVLLIGVNNTGFTNEPAGVIAQGVVAVVDRIEHAFPNADILLLAVFPYGENPTDPKRQVVKDINKGIASLGERDRVTYMDLASVFLEKDGSLSAEIMPDFLHLSAEGYQRWAQAILPWVDQRVPLPEVAALPHAFDAGWKGTDTCELLYESADVRVGQCTFPPGIGHEKHYHNPHWGYTLSGSTLRISDAEGTEDVVIETGLTWSTDQRTVHQAVNVGDQTTSYIIVEPR